MKKREVAEDIAFEEPEDGDIIIVDNPRGGYEAAEINGRVFAMSNDIDDIYYQIRKWMKKYKFYPNVWFQDDHGGVELVDVNESSEGKERGKEMKEATVYNYVIPEWAIGALMIGDYSGLDDEEEKKIDDFLKTLPGRQGHWGDFEDEPYFARGSDIDPRMGGNVYDVDYVVMKESVRQTKKVSESREMDAMLNGYLSAALWSEVDEEGDPLDSNYDISDINRGSIRKAERDIDTFLKGVRRHETKDLFDTLPVSSGDSGSPAWDTMGHDLWLTRNGHGAGFWDGGWGEYGDMLTSEAEKLGEAYAYVGDDGEVYID